MKKDLTPSILSLAAHVKVDEPLRNHTTYRIGGPARYLFDAESISELRNVLGFAAQNKLPTIILGAGSNILISDGGFNGIVIRLKGEFSLVTFGMNVVKAGAGAYLPSFVHDCALRSFSGMECLAGIPGTIGGAVVGNAGSRAGNIGDLVLEVEILSETGHVVTIPKDQLKFYYRGSNLGGKVIVAATLHLKKGQKNDILKNIHDNVQYRSETQPLDQWNAGSVFKNPEGARAGELIEKAGLKGLKFGGAQISEKHANFIVNTGDAKAADVKALISMAHNKVKEKFGINLALEIKMIGE